jgi:hypothetical protein
MFEVGGVRLSWCEIFATMDVREGCEIHHIKVCCENRVITANFREYLKAVITKATVSILTNKASYNLFYSPILRRGIPSQLFNKQRASHAILRR